MVEKSSYSGSAADLAEPGNDKKKKKHSSFHAILLMGILAGWTGSIFLYAVGTAGPLRLSVLIIISAIWMVAFFSVGSATLRKSPRL